LIRTLEERIASGIITFLCLCIVIAQLVIAAKQEATITTITTELRVLRSDLSNHNNSTISRLIEISNTLDMDKIKQSTLREGYHGSDSN
jgi:uncharacterized membrane protein